jgi:isopenicillin N synthase-like dioxygenase
MTHDPDTFGLPTVDISGFRASSEERAIFLASLRRLLHEHGFFYLKGHGVSPGLIEGVLAATKRFFALPLADKLAIEMVNSPHFRGYTRPGWEYTRGERDWREQLDINTEAEAILPVSGAPAWTRLIGPNQWPALQPELKPLLLAYQAEATRVAIEVLKAAAAALGQEETVFSDLYTPLPNQLLKIIRYPGREVAESAQGVGAHKDGGLITVLLQDAIEGLRVAGKNGEWLAAPPIPETFVINTGELLELATGGYVRANVHDVLAPPAGTERFSVAFFLGARLDATVPLIQLPEELRAGKRGVTADPSNPLFREVGRNALKSRLRSHPDVARRYHADLLTPEEKEGNAIASAY